MDLRQHILDDLLGRESVTLSPDQDDALGTFLAFVRSDELRNTFLLTGSAGTGKTFLIRFFTQYLRKVGYKVILLAPTGRAAKVITRRTQRPAYTIHHHIYSPSEGRAGNISFSLKANKEQSKTVYVVDEASMIGDKGDGSVPHSLLHDLMSYVFFEDEDRKLILVGDPVQLPPVGNDQSPALDPEYLLQKTWTTIFHAHLTDVKRQETDSGILEHALLMREALTSLEEAPTVELSPNHDVYLLETPYEAIETYIGYYEQGNPDRVVFLTYSNYQATRINQALRHNLFHAEDKLVASDLLMVVKNNYAWGDTKRLPFIANGEMVTVRDVYNDTYEEKYGLKWVDVEIELTDTRGEPLILEVKIILDLLDIKQPNLDADTQVTIFYERQREYTGLGPSKAMEMLRNDPYINALQVKYGYCITGHKSQGGQWENVIVGFEPDYGQNPRAYLRWTYTAMTRAEERLFLLNCPFVEQF